MESPFGKATQKLKNNPKYAQKITEAMNSGKPVIVLKQKGMKPKVRRMIGYPKKDISEYTPEEIFEIELD